MKNDITTIKRNVLLNSEFLYVCSNENFAPHFEDLSLEIFDDNKMTVEIAEEYFLSNISEIC